MVNVTPVFSLKRCYRLIICLQILIIAYVHHILLEPKTRVWSIPAPNGSNYRNLQPILSFPTFQIRDSYVEVVHVAERLGYQITANASSMFQCHTTADGKREDFFTCRQRRIMPYRIQTIDNATIKFVDHIPGLYQFITYKANLVTLGGKHIPKGFLLPKQMNEFLNYSEIDENRNKQWIQKNPFHRGNAVKDLKDLHLKKKATLVQEYVSNPFLIDGRKFSLGFFVAFSSANPLRAYILDSTMTTRFCEKKYYPEDLTDLATYISDGMDTFNIRFIGEIAPIKSYYSDYKYTQVKSLNTYVKSLGEDPSLIYSQIYAAVREALSKREAVIGQQVDSKAKYFELTRWDFILDSDLKIHLLEANISPAFACNRSIDHNALNPSFCYNVVYNVFRVMGIDSFNDFQNRTMSYIIRDGDVHVVDRICYTPSCASCNSKACWVCSQCVSQKQRNMLKAILWEHLRRGETRLVYPFLSNGSDFETFHEDDGNEDTMLATDWLGAKCDKDVQWCSSH